MTRKVNLRTRIVAQDDAATYLECLDCGELFEKGELEAPAPTKSLTSTRILTT